MNLSPLPIQKFFDNDGAPLVSGKLFTYVAGTTTKIATYRDQAGTLNTNPIVLDFRGEANVWLDQTLTYKFTLAPANDTDPPTRPIWTVDNISAAITYASLTQQILGQILWPRTAAEAAAGVTPAKYYFPPYDVRRYGVLFDGSTDNTAALAQAQLVFAQSKYLLFDAGGSSSACSYATSPNWALNNGRIDSAGYVLLKCTGTGAVFNFDAGAVANVYVEVMEVGDFTLDGGSTATSGLYNRGVVRSNFGKINVLNLAAGTNPAFYLNSAVLNTYTTPTCSTNVQPLSSPPYYGIYLSGRSATDYCSANTFLDVCFEGIPKGIYHEASHSSNNNFVGGTSEGNTIYGIEENSGCSGNIYINMACEANVTEDWLCGARGSQWIGGYANTRVHFTGGAFNHLEGGRFASILIDAPCVGIALTNVEYGFNAGVLTDNGTGTFYRNVRSAAGTYHEDTGAAAFRMTGGPFTMRLVGVGYSASMTPDAGVANSFAIIPNNGVAFTINAATNPTTGQIIHITIVNATGGALGAVTWSGYKLPAWTQPANGFNRTASFIYNGGWIAMRPDADVPN